LTCAAWLAAHAAYAQGPAPTAGLAFVDPAIAAKPYAEGRNPLYRELKATLARYDATWGALPYVRVPPGPELGPGSSGQRVAALRARLDVPGDAQRYDGALADAVARFQRAHGLAETGRADAATLQALNAGPR